MKTVEQYQEATRKRPNKALARRIARELFSNADAPDADRLHLMRDGNFQFTFWSKGSCENSIERILDRNTKLALRRRR